MPVIKSAKKKLRQDKKREKRNDLLRGALAKTLKMARKKPSKETVVKAVKLVDKLAKKGLLHKNKTARLKSSLSKLIKAKSPEKKAKKSSKK